MTRAAAIKAVAAKRGGGTTQEGSAFTWAPPVALVAVGLFVFSGLSSGPRETRSASAESSDSSGQVPEEEALELLKDVLTFNSEKGGERSFKGFSKAEYWDERYKKSDRPYDWYSGWDKIGPIVDKFMCDKTGGVLNVGCGNSRLPQELHAVGYVNVTSIDYSPSVIEKMQQKHADLGQKFLLMDMTQMTFPNESFDVVVDKGALDALYAGAHDKVLQAVPEFFRILKPGGRYFSITFGEAARRTELLSVPWASFETLMLAKQPQAHYIHVGTKA